MSILDQFTLIQGFDSSSASRTDIWEAKDNKTGAPFIFKAFVTQYHVTDRREEKTTADVPLSADLLLHELNTYKALRTALIDNPLINCRNILCIAGDGEFDAIDLKNFLLKNSTLSSRNIQLNIYNNLLFLLRLSDSHDRKAIDTIVKNPRTIQLGDLQIPFGNVDMIRLDYPIRYHCMITPKIDRQSLSDAIEEGKVINLSNLMRYLFVIAVTILMMSSVGVNQNDLHWGNILLSKSYYGPSPLHKRKYLLIFDDKVLLIDNPRIPILFDFDRAAIQNVRVPDLEADDMYSMGGNCPNFHRKRDFLKFLCCIWHYCNILQKRDPAAQTVQKEIMNTLVFSESIRSAITSSHRACWLTSAENQNISILCMSEALDKGMTSVLDIIRWVERKANFISCTVNELVAFPKQKALSIGRTRVQTLIREFSEDLTAEQLSSPQLLEQVVRANIQFINLRKKFNVSSERKRFLNLLTTSVVKSIQGMRS